MNSSTRHDHLRNTATKQVRLAGAMNHHYNLDGPENSNAMKSARRCKYLSLRAQTLAAETQQRFITPAVNFDFLSQLELNFGVGIGTPKQGEVFIKSI